MKKFTVVIAGLAAFVMASGPASSQETVKSYPLCSSPGQDSCQNLGEGGAPGRSRAADYPGGPPVFASGNEGSPGRDHSPQRHGHSHRRAHKSHR